MAGYVLSFSNEKLMHKCMREGFYSTLLNKEWTQPTAATLGDYVTMKVGDHVFFFSERKIYGVGELITSAQDTVVVENFSSATTAKKPEESNIENESIISPFVEFKNSNGEIDKKLHRWLITFKPSPYIFEEGVDMDDVLSSDPQAFRSLRVFQGLSFIKIDDIEDQALMAILLRKNQRCLVEGADGHIDLNSKAIHEKIALASQTRKLSPNVPNLLANRRKQKGKNKGSLDNEMLLEAGLLYQLTNGDPQTEKVFGSWDYLSHQVAASPFKPVSWMDKIDVFGYRYLPEYQPIIQSFLAIELKKDVVDESAISQVMKYVDWIKTERAGGDYSMIKAFVVGRKADMNRLTACLQESRRQFIRGTHPAESVSWNDITVVTYEVEDSGYISFKKQEPSAVTKVDLVWSLCDD